MLAGSYCGLRSQTKGLSFVISLRNLYRQLTIASRRLQDGIYTNA